ncbi:MAG: metal dependent phosphohydrolase [Halothiobacillaceae bacterium]|nr:MAG: metal dependent phosphohydrolase [Halothiobacillaceae bacterium]
MGCARAAALVETVTGLVSLPDACIRINEMVEDMSSSAADMANVLLQDVGMSARVLKVANSSFYRFPSKIDTVSRAITIIGTRELRFLVLATSAVRSFDGLPNNLVDMASYWRHSIYCGVVARILAGHCHVLHKERLFVSGLLHDVGHLVMYNKIPDLVQVMRHRAATAAIPLEEAERDVFDTDHAQIGAELLRKWNLPESLVEVVECHHVPQRAEKFKLETAIVHIANSMATLAEKGSVNVEDGPPIDPRAWEITRLNSGIIEPILQEARAQFLEALLLFLPGATSAVTQGARRG